MLLLLLVFVVAGFGAWFELEPKPSKSTGFWAWF
jgi:hypothetical protein